MEVKSSVAFFFVSVFFFFSLEEEERWESEPERDAEALEASFEG
jgi:hypothetical protein